MFIDQIKSEGLAHLSYVVGSAGHAAVVDPRRDCDVYVEVAADHDCKITHIFETHRNEDLLSGAAVLAKKTGARVYHGPNPAEDVAYAETAREGNRFELGDMRLTVLETPGHTDDSLSLAVVQKTSGDDVIAVFTGDALFVGDVGRTDFYPSRAREVAGLLYDSLRKLVELGDQAVVFPAHGAGSVCGSQMADRDFSTIGYERRNNPRLGIAERDTFIEAKLAERHEMPPYFRHMEKLNLSGAPPMDHPIAPPPLTAEAFKRAASDSVLVDVRSASAFLGSHLPGSFALPVGLLSSFAGWLLRPEDTIVLVAQDVDQARSAARLLARIGYDRVLGFLAPSLPAWAAAGEDFGALPVIEAREVRERLSRGYPGWTLLDVRSDEEVSEFRVPGAQHVYVGELPVRLEDLEQQQKYTVMCASGARATIAASVLLRAGWHQVDLFLGSVGAWKALRE
jgi:hydroxyacylglutathione hydrolase